MTRFSYSPKQQQKRGFSMIEIMVVVVIIGLLMAVVIPNISKKSLEARIMATKATMRSVSTALSSFEVRAGRLPTEEEGLEALFVQPSDLNEDEWAGPYLEDTPLDAWNKELIYRIPGTGRAYDLISLGPDKQEGTRDDITNERRRDRQTAEAD